VFETLVTSRGEPITEPIALVLADVENQKVLIGRLRKRSFWSEGNFKVPVLIFWSHERSVETVVIEKPTEEFEAQRVNVEVHGAFHRSRRTSQSNGVDARRVVLGVGHAT
jgi:hypothetical protein